MEGAFPGAGPALQAPLWLSPGLMPGLAACKAVSYPRLPPPCPHWGPHHCPLAIYSPGLCAFRELVPPSQLQAPPLGRRL